MLLNLPTPRPNKRWPQSAVGGEAAALPSREASTREGPTSRSSSQARRPPWAPKVPPPMSGRPRAPGASGKESSASQHLGTWQWDPAHAARSQSNPWLLSGLLGGPRRPPKRAFWAWVYLRQRSESPSCILDACVVSLIPKALTREQRAGPNERPCYCDSGKFHVRERGQGRSSILM